MTAGAVGFHEGELAVQARAGVTADAARLAGMVAPTDLSGGVTRFLAERTFAALTARDSAGRLWVSPLSGPPGFLAADTPAALTVHTAPGPGDPLRALPAGQPVGLVVIEFATRRRVRVNGRLSAAAPDALTVEVDQAYGNCPQYIHPRRLRPAATAGTDEVSGVRRGTALTEGDRALLTAADTFFLGTVHPTRGADASHRGGPAGFLHVDGDELWWPDYPGNNMFNSFGNLAVDPTAALLVADFRTGDTVALSGTARVEWAAGGAAADAGPTGRTVRFRPDAVVSGRLLPVREDARPSR